MTEPLRAGLIGCGSLSQRGVLPHLTQPDAMQRLRLVAVADVVAERAQASAERFGIDAHFTTIEEMLEKVEIDIALVITPIPYHYANAMAAIQAGKHVYIQKAMTTTLAEADDLIETAARKGVKLAAAPGYELFPTTGQMRTALQAGAIGHICIGHTYTMGFGHEHEPIRGGEGTLAAIDPSWYYRPGAGPLPDVTVYSLQLATSLLGPVQRVTALSNTIAPERTWQGKSISVDIEDNNLVLMEFRSGALVTAVGSNCRGSRRIPWGGMGLFGTEGVLEVTEVDHASGYPTAYEISGPKAEQVTVPLHAQPYLTGAHLEIEEPHVYVDIMDLADSIVEGREPLASVDQARHVVEIIEKARLASATGQVQTLTSHF
jgi:predicted dehydrogenase